MSYLNNESIKIILNMLLLIIVGHQLQAQNEYATSEINLHKVVPVSCVVGFAFFMFHAFLKQKDN